MLTIQVKFFDTDTLEDCVKQATEFARSNNCCVEFEKNGVRQDITPYTLDELKQQEFLLKKQKELVDMENIYQKKIYGK